MSISGLGTYSSSSYYYAAVTKSRSGSLSNCPDSYAGKEISKDNPMYEFKQAAKKAVTTSPYCKCIIANIKTEQFTVSQDATGEMIYSYQKTEQSFQVFIKSDGQNKTYFVKGYDKDGKPFEKELNPEDIDPEHADFPEFSALCMYFEHTEETSNMLANDYFDTDDILEKANYLEKLHRFANDNLMEKTQSMIECANRLFNDFHQLMNAKADINSLFEPYFMRFLSMDIVQREQSEEPDVSEKLSEVHSSEKVQEESTGKEQVTPLGIGFANAGNMGYGMSASLVTKPGCDDTIIRVKVATGNGSEYIDVNLSKFAPKNATAVEVFAYCQYKDAAGEGVNSKWGSWNAMKTVISPTAGMDFGSLDNILNEKTDWTGALEKSKTIFEKEKTGETISAAELLKLFEETHKLTAQELKEEKDWREMSEDEWDKMLEGIDKYIDAFKERIRKLKEMQEEAARKAAMQASPDMKTTAAASAALNVAAGGSLDGEVSEENVVNDESFEKNWTKKLETDDQIILRTAKAAQDMEKKAMSKYEEVMLTDNTTVGIARTDEVTECAAVEKDDDAKKVQDFLDRFDKDANLIFTGSKEFWKKTLTENVDGNSLFAAQEVPLFFSKPLAYTENL